MELIAEGRPDVFISHAQEDKDDVARPLAEQLRGHGLNVWFDEFALKLGDRIRLGIDKALGSTRFGAVVLSQNFFEAQWPQWELSALLEREVWGEDVLLPIWHRITHEYILRRSPLIAGRLAYSTIRGTAFIAEKIVEKTAPEKLLPKSVDRHPFSRLFTYGTAISLEQLARYLEWSLLDTKSVFSNPRIGTLYNYRIAFSTPFGDNAPHRGASNLEYWVDGKVEGIVYDVDQLTLAELEKSIKKQYWLVPVDIKTADSRVLDCQTFIATCPRPGLKPHRKFIDYMIDASLAAGLSVDFVESLRKFDVLPDESNKLFW